MSSYICLRIPSYIIIMKKKLTPTEAELEILQVLWTYSKCTVRFVNDMLNNTKITGYTTTLKLLQIMFEKGLVIRNVDSRSHVYEANIIKEDIQGRLLDKLMDSAFGGSASGLVMQALGKHKPSGEELDKIKKIIRDIEKE